MEEKSEASERKAEIQKHLHNPNDPLEAVIRRGWIMAVGARGEFRRTPITLVGYFLLGLMSLAVAVFLIWCYVSLEWVLLVFFGPLAVLFLLIGFKILRNVFLGGNKNVHTHK